MSGQGRSGAGDHLSNVTSLEPEAEGKGVSLATSSHSRGKNVGLVISKFSSSTSPTLAFKDRALRDNLNSIKEVNVHTQDIDNNQGPRKDQAGIHHGAGDKHTDNAYD